MNKKTFSVVMCVVLLLLAWHAEAQQSGKIPRIGYLSLAAKPSPRDEAFAQGLRELGWVDGQSITIEYRWAANKPENLAALADELVALKVDLIAAVGTIAVNAAKNATKTIPIVMIGVADAVSSGFVASLAQPGRNITGTTSVMPELAGEAFGAAQGTSSEAFARGLSCLRAGSSSPAVCEASTGRCPEFQDTVSAVGVRRCRGDRRRLLSDD
jgi:putative tryptophan/tyrosine transport system substrate-binding protein